MNFNKKIIELKELLIETTFEILGKISTFSIVLFYILIGLSVFLFTPLLLFKIINSNKGIVFINKLCDIPLSFLKWLWHNWLGVLLGVTFTIVFVIILTFLIRLLKQLPDKE
ncbi:MAG: hypothetical protein PF448_08530 [Bacteroidales bacterium]|jgi:phosphotransferase system  glucose/maltose/N-acetylglucosamine-specific IIC component|nr:hypothetical protein [Bacteroidales bacterium]